MVSQDLAVLRRAAFAAVDRLRGGPVRLHLADLRRAYADPEYQRRVRHERALDLIAYARRHTENYASVPADAPLTNLPLIDKAAVRASMGAFRARGFQGKLHPVTTSGSHGAPFRYYHSNEKRARKLAELIHFNWLAGGYRVGSPHILMRATPKSRLKCFLQNERWVDPTVLDAVFHSRTLDLLSKHWGRTVIGHPSVMASLATHARSRGISSQQFKVRAFIATSEALNEVDRERIESAFDCTVTSRYASEEFGILAHEIPGSPGFQVNSSSYLIEALQLDGSAPAPVGSVGRIVVTDLFSHPVPLIRYSIGDLAVVRERDPDDGAVLVLDSIEGKQVEAIFDASGRWLSPHAIAVAFKDLDHIAQFQLIQTAVREFALKLVSIDGRVDEADIRERMHRILGDDAHIMTEWVDAIPELPSGKRPFVLNRMASAGVGRGPGGGGTYELVGK